MSDSSEAYEQQLYKTLDYSINQFDKNALFIASGALGISFAFIDKFIPDGKDPIHVDLLMLSWLVFGVTIFLSLFGHFISSQSIRWTILNYRKDKKYQERAKKKWNLAIRSMNVINMILILLGIIFLIIFVKHNINNNV